ncbi:MAG TPA: nitroreductase family protein [Firmicutes bacterium]|nr:nitroreductase family protein [Bacillota bacterium]
MDILGLVKKNRSYRKYKESEPVSKEQLKGFVNAARFTASSVNLQPLRYLLSNEQKTNQKIFAHTKWARLLKNYDGPEIGERPSAYVVVVQDKKVAENTQRFLVDVGIVSQTILLAAVEAGLGGIMIRNFVAEDLARDLELEERYVPMMILAIGVPDEEIILEEIEEGCSTAYYRDEKNIHHVPKRRLDDILL